MKRLFSRNNIISVTILIFIVVIMISTLFSEKTGTTIFTLAILGIIVIFAITIGTKKEDADTFDTSHFPLSYLYKKIHPVPWGSISLNIISLIWLLISKLQNSNPDIAIAFFIIFFLLAMFEYLINWFKETRFNGFTYSYNSHGITISKGKWNKEYPWSDYTHASTSFYAKKGNFFQFIPFSSIFIHNSDHNIINLYRKPEFWHSTDPTTEPEAEIKYDQILSLPNNHDQAVRFIKQYVNYQGS